MTAEPTSDVRPFPWDSIPSFERDRVTRANRLLRVIPRRDEKSEALEQLAGQLEELTGLEHSLEVRGVRIRKEGAEPPTFGDAFRTQFQLPPHPELGAVAVDMELVDAWLGSLLDAPPETRRLGAVGDREFGLVTFVLLSVLKKLRDWGAPPVVVPTEPPLDEIFEDELRDEGPIVELTVRAQTLGETHLVRIFVPDGLLRNMEMIAEGTARRSAFARRAQEGSLGDLELSFPVSAGITRLRREVASELDRGVVVLFDADGWTADCEHLEDESEDANPGARMYLRSHSRDRYLAGYLRARPSGWGFEIADRRLRTHEPTMSESHDASGAQTSPGETDAETSPGTTELLESPEVELEVHVGTAHLTVRELGELGGGQILELDRDVDDRVDLVVEGERVGTGELVEIEGRLGVRVVQFEN